MHLKSQTGNHCTPSLDTFTLSVLQGPAAADSMPSSEFNLSGTTCSSSEVSDSESQYLTNALGFSSHLFIFIDVAKEMLRFIELFQADLLVFTPDIVILFHSLSHFRLLLPRALSTQLTSVLKNAAEQRLADQILKMLQLFLIQWQPLKSSLTTFAVLLSTF